uniref:Sulfotransferase n=1 Tax=Takifugu rubripes TaxID=31033 RepID=H2S4K2_TAKRU
MNPLNTCELFDFHGISMTHYFTSNWENIQKFQARPDDVFIASYPKAGNTWLCYILDLLYFGPTSMSHHERVPNLEITIPSRLTGYLEYMKSFGSIFYSKKIIFIPG